MRDISHYTSLEWICAQPAVAAFREVRDAVIRDIYCGRHPKNLQDFLSESSSLRGSRIAIIIAYQEPWLIHHLTQRLKEFVPDFHPIVLDNSATASVRTLFAEICAKNDASYFGLPDSPIRNINRSHGNALNWAYRNIVTALEPELFALLDHDIFPTEPFDLADRLGNQPFYGHKIDCGFGWALWAGYSVFRYADIRNAKPDFNPDMDRGLITGGRNLSRIYRHYDEANIRFAQQQRLPVPDKVNGVIYASELIDGWFHIGGPAFREHKTLSRSFFEPMLKKTGPIDPS